MSVMLRVALVLTLLCAGAQAARAADVAACVQAADAGQVQRDERKLSEARASFVTCADAGCPAAVRKECTGWLAEVDARLPSIVVVVRDAQGHDVSGAEVWLDETRLEAGSLGRELPLDPGPHLLVARRGETVSELKLVASEREQGRIVTLTLAPAPVVVETPKQPAPPAPASPARAWLGPVITMSAGALMLGTAGVLTLSASAQADDLRGRCAPTCSASEVETLERRGHVADALLVVGAVAVLGGGVWWLWPRKKPAATELSLSPRGLSVRGTF